MKSLSIIFLLLTLIISFHAEAATRRGDVSISNEIISGGFFGGIKNGMLILNLSKQGHIKTYYVSLALKVLYRGAEIEIGNLPLNTEIRITTNSNGYVTKVLVLEGGQ